MDQENDEEFFGIKPQQSPYELQHFDARDQEFLTRISILSQQCNLLRSRNSFDRDYFQEKVQSLERENSQLRAEMAPLISLHQKVTSGYALLAIIGAVALGILELVKGLKSVVFGK